MNEFMGYILANVEHMNDSIANVQRAMSRLSKSNRNILIGLAACLGLSYIQEKRIHELKSSVAAMKKEVNRIQTMIEEG